jgi:small conductance mechanosensitive channel
VVFALSKLTSIVFDKFFTLKAKGKRIKAVFIGTLYVLVLVSTALLVLKNIGYDVSTVGQLSILIILIGSVIAFFLVPFLPKLPFIIGNMVEISGTLGIVESISTFYTQLKTLDGKTVYIPNAVLMASKISNYHQIPNRRIELNFNVDVSCDLGLCKQYLLEIMTKENRVLTDPAPAVFFVDVTAAGATINGLCWATNDDWFSTRSDLWLQVVDKFQTNSNVSLALDKTEILLSKT